MYSLRDSIITPQDLVERLKEIDQNIVAITDHGNLLSGVALYKELKKNNIKLILGCEFYICDDTKIKDKDSKYYHLVALCLNDKGRLNLNSLISKSNHPDNFYYKPRIDFEMLKEYSEGLLIMSACLAGEVSKNIEKGDYNKAKSIALKYKECFGDNYYLEVQSHRDDTQIAINKEIYRLSSETGIKCVVTTDAHYAWETDKEYQNKYAFNGAYKEDGEAYIDCFLQSEAQVRERLPYFSENVVTELITVTHKIAEKCNVEMPLSPPIMPEVNTPEQFDNNREWLENICKDGFKEKLNIDCDNKRLFDRERFLSRNVYDENGEYVETIKYQLSLDEINEYVDRYYYELNSLDRMGFLDYILLVYSYANVAKRRGIARGSGGGSLICYVANITNIDPIEHGLYFERFIDVGALPRLEAGEITSKELKIPDIDLDFSGESCKYVLKYLFNEYGEENVASIGRFGTNHTKGTIRDMCKVFNIDLATEGLISKSFESYEIDELDNLIEAGERMPESAKQAVEYINIYPELFKYVRKLTGLPKSFGLHPCGRVIATRPLDEYLPSCYDDNGIRYLQGDMHDVEDVGLVKVDILGLRTLDQEYETLEMSNQDKEYINPKTQDYADPKVLSVFKKGDTTGIFQFSSYGMKQTLKKMDVRGIEDLAVANALYRPGAMSYIDNFCDRRKGKEEFEFLHPDLENILKNTYGIIVFQEQLIEIGRLAKIHNPDLLRKATGKKDIKLLNQVKPELEEKLKGRGWNQEQFDTLWTDMIEFSKYSFNKSHASAYAILAYITAKQKAYYPSEFFAGLCNSYIGESSYVKDNAEEIIQDMDKHKLILLPFSFRNDHRRCSAVENKILYGIPLIRDCNETVANALYEIREKSYSHFWNLLQDIYSLGAKRSQVDKLIKLNFFSEFGNAKQLLRIYDLFEYFKQGDCKEIKKEKLKSNEIMYSIVSKYATDIGVKGNELKSYKIQDIISILNECEDYMLSLNITDFDFRSKILDQQEFLGFVSLITGREEDRPTLYIKKVSPLYRKKDNVQFGYSVVGKSVGSGIETRYTVMNKLYNKDPILTSDIITCKKYSCERGYFTIEAYEKQF